MHSALDSERIEIVNYMKDTFRSDIRKDVLHGLTLDQKSIPSKYFYDEKGSRLFEKICSLPEYYQTRTELSILKRSAMEIMGNADGLDIIELGSGSNLKVRTLLDAGFSTRRADICYVPIDVSEFALVESAVELADFYPRIRIVGIVADFTRNIEKIIPAGRQRLFVLFGSTIGNFSSAERISLLKSVAGMMGRHDRFLLGIDMVKHVRVLERAYNDDMGVTAAFNKNILDVVNRELRADFDASHFDHVAFFNTEKEQVEMHLRTNRDILVEIERLDMCVSMNQNETIHTEICGKFSRESANSMAKDTGLRITRWFTDAQGWFSLAELHRIPERRQEAEYFCE